MPVNPFLLPIDPVQMFDPVTLSLTQGAIVPEPGSAFPCALAVLLMLSAGVRKLTTLPDTSSDPG